MSEHPPTGRKPAGVDFETWVDRKIREATERGEFENLAGAGRPLPGAGNPYHDENAWLRDYLRREGVSGDLMLPPSLQLRREIERFPETVAELPTEVAVREAVAGLNRRVVDWLRMPIGPQVPISPVDADEVVRAWRAAPAAPRGERGPAPRPEPLAPAAADTRAPVRWWRRIFGGR
ncbi:DnaJ family domain-containing protein [Nocardia sp. NPDC003345]